MGLPDLKVLYPNKPKNQVFSKYIQVSIKRVCYVWERQVYPVVTTDITIYLVEHIFWFIKFVYQIIDFYSI